MAHKGDPVSELEKSQSLPRQSGGGIATQAEERKTLEKAGVNVDPLPANSVRGSKMKERIIKK